MSTHDDRSDHSLGYQFREPFSIDMQAYAGVDVYLREEPTLQHYDPERMDIQVWPEEERALADRIEKLKIHHPWPGGDSYRAVLGHVILHDRLGKAVEMFTFGGQLSIQGESNLTHCQLRSEAPIISLEGAGSLGELFVAEVEATLAVLRAEASITSQEAERNLGQLSPLEVYVGCLLSLGGKLANFNHKELLAYQHLLGLISNEQDRLKAESVWPQDAKRLHDLLLD